VHGTSVVLHPGSGGTRLVSYIRDCDGNCGTLDAPAQRCSVVLTFEGSPVTGKTTVQLRDQGCRNVLR
jgi:hypothetical protein